MMSACADWKWESMRLNSLGRNAILMGIVLGSSVALR